ncbi:MAG TPA: membrane dipeptidase [Thermoleophilaceae bacterium]|nr:membrane dipeptidase [Thermoleophilaceae bacterium]
MVTDLHAHYPMRVLGDVTPETVVETMRKARRRPGLGDKLRALVLRIASTFFSDTDPFSGPRITPELLRKGGVGVALSVLYRPVEEADPDERFTSPPKSSYFAALLGDLETVEEEVASHDRSQIRLVHNRAELDQCVADGATALVHVVEGAFHLGGRAEEIEDRVAELARRGVGYITVAHLFFRGVATAAPAFPFLGERGYHLLLPQPAGEGLTELGIAVVKAMARNRILVDLSHSGDDSVAETLQVLDEVDPDRSLPVVSTHAGFRFGEQEYMHDESAIRRIAERDGVVGLIMAQYQILDGLRDDAPRDFDQSFEVIRRHIDRIAEITGGHRHVALGTDFDGFVKPTLTGIENMGDLKRLEEALVAAYGSDAAEQITSGNTLRVLRQLWR